MIMTLYPGGLLIVIGYVTLVRILLWGVNKLNKDVKSIMSAMVYEINQLFLLINAYIAHHHDEIDKIDELTQVIYAKKKWFIHSKMHTLTDRYELYVGLKDDISYLSDYVDEDLSDVASYENIDKLFGFLFSTKPWIKSLRLVFMLTTFGLGGGLLED